MTSIPGGNPPKYVVTDFSSPICSWSLPLVARKDGVWYPSGTAIIIGKWFAMTAKHVIDDFIDRFGTTETGPNRFHHHFALQAAQIVENGTSADLWDIDKIWRSTQTDIAFLRLKPRNERSLEFPWKKLSLDLRPLKVGDSIVAFGFPKPRIEIDDTGEISTVTWTVDPRTSTGCVTKIYPEKRDSALLKFPCYQANALFDPSMSGGPVFTKSGHLCGLVCTGFDFPIDENIHVSFFCALWPSMATEIDFDRVGYRKGLRYPVLDLAKDGLIDATGWEKVDIIKFHGTNRTRVQFLNIDIPLLEQKSAQGDTKAQVELAAAYLSGVGTQKDEFRAVELFQKAANAGDADGMNNLGVCFRDGKGIEQDLKKALTFLRAASKKNHAEAMVTLGAMYFKGQGVERDYKEAFSLWQQAASLGSANAAFNLGQCFSAGAGSPKDNNKAAYWLEIALERGHPVARKRLSEIQQKRQ